MQANMMAYVMLVKWWGLSSVMQLSTGVVVLDLDHFITPCLLSLVVTAMH
jgi:hypothetical protein